MAELKGQEAELKFQIQITRAATGKVEDYTLVGKITDEQLKEIQDGNNSLNSST